LIEVCGEPRTADEWIDTYVRPLAQITTFATADEQPICWVQLTTPREPSRTVQVFTSEITQKPYDAQPPEPGGLISLLRLGSSGFSLAKLLTTWQDIRKQYDTFFDYLTTSLRGQMTMKARFLALIPALESFHTTKYGDGPLPRREFLRERKALLRRLKDNETVNDNDVEWLETWLDTIGSYQLQERLHELLDKDLGTALRDRLEARVSPLPNHLTDIIKGTTDIWRVMGKVRNNLAHGGSQPTQEQLVSLTRLAHTMAIGLMLRQLEVSDSALVEAIDQELWSVL